MQKLELPEIRFCPACGGTMNVTLCEGTSRPVCESCGKPVYVNPYPATCQVVLRGSDVLLVLRGIEPRKGWWCLPGGFIEWGESPEDAAKRELAEETGITAESLSLVGVYGSVTGKQRHVLLIAYEADRWRGEPVAGDDASAVSWFPLGAVPPLAFESHGQVIADVLKGKESR